MIRYWCLFFIMLIHVINPCAWGQGFFVSKVDLSCESSKACNRLIRSFVRLVGNYESKEHFQLVFKEFLSDVGYESLSFNLVPEQDSFVLDIQIKPKKIIQLDIYRAADIQNYLFKLLLFGNYRLGRISKRRLFSKLKLILFR